MTASVGRPPWTSAELRTPTSSIEHRTAELRKLRARIDSQRDNPHTWPTTEEELAADLLRYDRRLLKAVAVRRLGSGGRGRGSAQLSEADRLEIEHRLDISGYSVRPTADTRSRDRGEGSES